MFTFVNNYIQDAQNYRKPQKNHRKRKIELLTDCT